MITLQESSYNVEPYDAEALHDKTLIIELNHCILYLRSGTMADPAEDMIVYTYADYSKWPEEFRCELIEGHVYMMAPPNIWHQKMVGQLYSQLQGFLEGRKCIPLVSVGLRLFPNDDESDNSALVPDLIVVCDEKKLSDGKTCRGAPDFIIEILSPSTKNRDLTDKKRLYAQAGVKEYWLIDREILYKCVLDNGSFTETAIHYLFDKEPIPIKALPGCKLSIPIYE